LTSALAGHNLNLVQIFDISVLKSIGQIQQCIFACQAVDSVLCKSKRSYDSVGQFVCTR
jgi:hypothetical protein